LQVRNIPRIALVIVLAGVALWLLNMQPQHHDAKARAIIEAVMHEPLIHEAVRASNQTPMNDAEIAANDTAWVALNKAHHGIIAQMLATPASTWLNQQSNQSNGILRQVIVMDNRGCNAAIAYPTTDYDQGDEPQWQRVFPTRTPLFAQYELGYEGGNVCWLSLPLEDIGVVSLEFDRAYVSDAVCEGKGL
jgi:hypothetical protein